MSGHKQSFKKRNLKPILWLLCPNVCIRPAYGSGVGYRPQLNMLSNATSETGHSISGNSNGLRGPDSFACDVLVPGLCKTEFSPEINIRANVKSMQFPLPPPPPPQVKQSNAYVFYSCLHSVVPVSPTNHTDKHLHRHVWH